MRAEMGEDLAHFDDSDSEDGDSGKPSLVLVNPDRRQSTYPKQEVYDCFSGIQLLNTVKHIYTDKFRFIAGRAKFLRQ